MTKGNVKWYNEAKDFNFIESVEVNNVFVHRSGLNNSSESLQTDQIIPFEAKLGDKGSFATNVKSTV